MSKTTKYELLERQHKYERPIRCVKAALLLLLCLLSLVAIGLTWMVSDREVLRYPPVLPNLPEEFLQSRIANHETLQGHPLPRHLHHNTMERVSVGHREPIDLGAVNGDNKTAERFRLVCYYIFPKVINSIKGRPNASYADELLPKDIDPHLCTHLNVGYIPIQNNSMVLDENQKMYLSTQIRELRRQNKDLKVLFWVGGGAFDYGFPDMVRNHKSRKQFIQSLKFNLETYFVDGVDLDWEFPSPYNKDRQHFSQLLHEIRREYQREHRTYLLTIAMPAPAQYQNALYDIDVINENCDWINVMAYDYNLYGPSTPFTGLNAPLYASDADRGGVFAYLNINYTVYNLMVNGGLDRSKIVIGLPTYGHSFRLVSPFNHHIHSPASGNGRLGAMGFVTYSDVCWFKLNNYYVETVFDEPSCSPYMYSVFEWFSYENERSIDCKSRWIRDGRFGGAMVFSLNSDDFSLYCFSDGGVAATAAAGENGPRDDFKFPLTRKVREILNP